MFLFSLNIIAEDGKLENDSIDIPDIIDEEEISRNGYVAREKDLEKDLYTLSFLNKDGTHTMRVFDHQVKYFDKSGSIKDISLNLDENEESYISAENDIITRFPKVLYEGISVALNNDKIIILPSNAEDFDNAYFDRNEMMVSYNYTNSILYQYKLTYEGYNNTIVTFNMEKNEFKFVVLTNGLEIIDKLGTLYLVDINNIPKATISDVIISTADAQNNIIGNIEYREIKKCEKYELTVSCYDDQLNYKEMISPIYWSFDVSLNRENKENESVILEYSCSSSDACSNIYFVGNSKDYINNLQITSCVYFDNLKMPVVFSPFIISAELEIDNQLCNDSKDIRVFSCSKFDNSLFKDSLTVSSSNESCLTECIPISSDFIIQYKYNDFPEIYHGFKFDITSVAKEWSMDSNSQERMIYLSDTSNNIKSHSNYHHNISLAFTYSTIGVFQMYSYGHLIFEPLKADAETFDLITTSYNAMNQYDGTCLWCIECIPNSNAVTINSLGVSSTFKEKSCVLTTNSAGTFLTEKNEYPGITDNFYKYIPETYAGFYTAFKNVYSGYYMSLPYNESVMSSSSVLDSSCALYLSEIDINTFNNFWSGSYSTGFTEYGMSIQIVLDSSINNSNYYSNNDFSYATLWNDLTPYITVYGPNDQVPYDEHPLEVKFKAIDNFYFSDYTYMDDLENVVPDYVFEQYLCFAQTVPNVNSITDLELYNDSDSSLYRSTLLGSNWSSVTIYLNDNNNPRFNMLADTGLSEYEKNILINTAICHEMGHALKLAHPSQRNSIPPRFYETGMRNDYGMQNGTYNIYAANSAVYSVMNSPYEQYVDNNENPNTYQDLSAITPQFHDIVNLISKWYYHINS